SCTAWLAESSCPALAGHPMSHWHSDGLDKESIIPRGFCPLSLRCATPTSTSTRPTSDVRIPGSTVLVAIRLASHRRLFGDSVHDGPKHGAAPACSGVHLRSARVVLKAAESPAICRYPLSPVMVDRLARPFRRQQRTDKFCLPPSRNA